MVNYNAVGLDLSGLTGAIDAIGRRTLQEQERQRLEQEKLRSAQEVGAFGDRLLGTIATSGGSGGGAPSRGAELMGIGQQPAFAGGSARMSMPADPRVKSTFINTLREGGLTNPYGLAAFAAYADAESGYSPRNITGSWSDPSERGAPGTSGGILSWRGDRLANMRRQTAGMDPVVGQAKFALTENPEVTMALQNAKSPEEANQILANAWRFAGYNRPGGENARRLAMTNQYVSQVNDNKGTPGVAKEAGTQQVATASPADADRTAPQQDWRTAQASPEEFERQLVAARTGVASPVKRIAPTVGGETGGVSAPAVNVAGRMPSVPAGVGQGEITPERLQMLREGLQSRNPAVQQMAIQEINRIREAQSKGPDYESVAPGATLYDKRSGRAIYTAPKDGAGVKWELKELKDGRVVLHNPVTNEVKPAPIEGATGKARPNFEVEDKLRDDYEKKLKPFEELQDAYGSVRAAVQGRIEAPDVQSPASDMALIFAYMKMLDPSSVVREGEYDKVGNTTNIPGKVLNYLNRARTGEMLNDDQIEDIVKSAHRRYEQKYKDTEKIADRFRQLAPHYGIDDPNRIVFLPERAEMPQIPRRGAGGGQKRDANQYGVVPTQRAWTNPDGSAPVFKSGQYTVERYNP